MTEPFRELATVLHGVVDGIASQFGPARMLTDERQAADPLPRPTSLVWTYQVSVHMSPDAPAVLTEQVVPAMTAEGWQVTSRDSDRAFGVHFGRDGFDVGVMIGRSDRAEIVVGGSTPDVTLA